MLFCGALSFSTNLAFPVQVSMDGPRSFILLTVSCVLLVSALLLLTVSSESPAGASGSCLLGPRKRFLLAFLRPEIVFAATFYK